jgi:hypothetical protein
MHEPFQNEPVALDAYLLSTPFVREIAEAVPRNRSHHSRKRNHCVALSQRWRPTSRFYTSVVSRHVRCMVCQMIRFATAPLLIGLGAGLCGCGSRSEVLRAEPPQLQRVRDNVSPEPAVATRRVQPAALTDAGEITGSIARSNDIRPWPKRGTAEFDQLQAEELAREQRIKEVLSSICRGC